MQLKKAFSFLNRLPVKLNNFHIIRLKSKIVIKNKSKDKKTFDPVTNLDQAFEKYIRSLIIKKFPQDSIIGEEFKKKESLNDYTWTIDPIDGTKAFVIGAPTWSNLIGLSYLKKSLLGLANFPELNKYYINDKNRSYVCKNKKKYILRSSKNINLRTVKVISHGNINYEKLRKISKKFGPQFRIASFDALNFCLLAEGKVDAVIEGNLKTYDILPLIPIIKNSGGVVTNWSGEPAEKAGNIIASSNRKLHNKILKLLSPFVKK
jgi:histidinol phosphatase-like enzyme (inositol monophosphatase family)